jgi:hypothetical protein
MHRALRAVLVGLGAIWTSPNTALGLLCGGLGLLRGARLEWSDGAVVFQRYPWGPGGALTLGQVILHTGTSLDLRCRGYDQRAGAPDPDGCTTIRLGDHERAHVLQYLLFGPLFLPLYLLCGGISARNPFERAADRYARGGSWRPWERDA